MDHMVVSRHNALGAHVLEGLHVLELGTEYARVYHQKRRYANLARHLKILQWESLITSPRDNVLCVGCLMYVSATVWLSVVFRVLTLVNLICVLSLTVSLLWKYSTCQYSNVVSTKAELNPCMCLMCKILSAEQITDINWQDALRGHFGGFSTMWVCKAIRLKYNS